MDITAQEEKAEIEEHTTHELPRSGLLLSARAISHSDADISVGHLGRPNSTGKLKVGDYILFSKNDLEIYEIRLFRLRTDIRPYYGTFRRVDVATMVIRPIPVGVFVGTTKESFGASMKQTAGTNEFLTRTDLERVHRAVDELRKAVRVFDPPPQALAEIDEHLDRMEAAATKIGRRDWITLALGTITNIVIVGSLGPDPARSLFALVVRLITWCFSPAPSLPPLL